jgi:hypothetical protein
MTTVPNTTLATSAAVCARHDCSKRPQALCARSRASAGVAGPTSGLKPRLVLAFGTTPTRRTRLNSRPRATGFRKNGRCGNLVRAPYLIGRFVDGPRHMLNDLRRGPLAWRSWHIPVGNSRLRRGEERLDSSCRRSETASRSLMDLPSRVLCEPPNGQGLNCVAPAGTESPDGGWRMAD